MEKSSKLRPNHLRYCSTLEQKNSPWTFKKVFVSMLWCGNFIKASVMSIYSFIIVHWKVLNYNFKSLSSIFLILIYSVLSNSFFVFTATVRTTSCFATSLAPSEKWRENRSTLRSSLPLTKFLRWTILLQKTRIQ
jgi:hypothetical protein